MTTLPQPPQPAAQPPNELEEVQRLGTLALPIIVRCLKTAAIYQIDNDAVRKMIADTVASLQPLFNLKGTLRFQVIGQHAFLNQSALRLKETALESLTTLKRIFDKLGIHEVSFAEDLRETDLYEFLAAFQRHLRSADPGAIKQEKWARIGVRAVQTGSHERTEQIDLRQNVLRLYAQSVVDLKVAIDEVKRGSPRPPLNKLRQDLQGLVDHSGAYESLLVGLTRADLSRGDHAYHAAAVGVLALLLSRRLGLDKKALVDVGLAGVFHDLGRAELPEFTGSESAEGEYAAAAQRVPLRTVLQLAAAGLHRESLERIVVAHEHSLALAPERGPAPSMLARLVAVPCAYDLMTAPPPPRPPIMPDHALRLMVDKGGTRFDARIVKLFVATVGLFPVGTTVKLSGGQIAVVIEAPLDPAQASLPRVRVIREASGPADYVVDLAQPGEKLRIVGAVDAKQERVNVTHFLFA
jgi:HD-GYP domain-containing protein (c-di-GMP phosphodiesterase class II)